MSRVEYGDSGKKLYRKADSRKIAGVCAGLAEYFGWDPAIVRILFLFGVIFGGFGLVLYLVCWVAMPSEGQTKRRSRP